MRARERGIEHLGDFGDGLRSEIRIVNVRLDLLDRRIFDRILVVLVSGLGVCTGFGFRGCRTGFGFSGLSSRCWIQILGTARWATMVSVPLNFRV